MKHSQKVSAFLVLVVIVGGVYLYSQKDNKISAIPDGQDFSKKLKGRFVLKDAACAGFEFGTDPSKVIWRNEIECSVSDTNSDYYNTEALFWLDAKTFVVKDLERTNKTSSPRVDIYVVQNYDGHNLTLKSLWTGWGDYKFTILEFIKK